MKVRFYNLQYLIIDQRCLWETWHFRSCSRVGMALKELGKHFTTKWYGRLIFDQPRNLQWCKPRCLLKAVLSEHVWDEDWKCIVVICYFAGVGACVSCIGGFCFSGSSHRGSQGIAKAHGQVPYHLKIHWREEVQQAERGVIQHLERLAIEKSYQSIITTWRTTR